MRLIRDGHGPGPEYDAARGGNGVTTGWTGGPGKGCESTPDSVLMFCVSEGAGPKGTEPEDTPNARVAE